MKTLDKLLVVAILQAHAIIHTCVIYKAVYAPYFSLTFITAVSH